MIQLTGMIFEGVPEKLPAPCGSASWRRMLLAAVLDGPHGRRVGEARRGRGAALPEEAQRVPALREPLLSPRRATRSPCPRSSAGSATTSFYASDVPTGPRLPRERARARHAGRSDPRRAGGRSSTKTRAGCTSCRRRRPSLEQRRAPGPHGPVLPRPAHRRVVGLHRRVRLDLARRERLDLAQAQRVQEHPGIDRHVDGPSGSPPGASAGRREAVAPHQHHPLRPQRPGQIASFAPCSPPADSWRRTGPGCPTPEGARR